ncbi:MAG TPA: TIGR01777 family oxidoreductase [Vicinamibacterales bacterium]|nr:TIGR01777 family oxidoreductase [Vicinamibacterales bacterium]
MKVVVAGGTGFLGSALCWAWAEEGHEIRVLTRGLAPGQAQHDSGTGKPGITRVGWNPDGHAGTIAQELEGASALINLAGASISRGRWSAARKQTLRESRIRPTRSLVDALAQTHTPPRVFLSASGAGYYGDRGADTLSEDAAPGDDFLAHLCVEWEAEAQRAERPAVRVVPIRTGLVLEKSGGALAAMMPPFKFFAGGRMASGRQYMPWIHRLDWIEMVRWIVDTPAIAGPVNATAPHPVTNAEFARALGRALRRPALLPAPRFALRLALGELGDAVLASQRAIPAVALSHGYHFRYPEIEIAFRGIFGD